MITSTIYLDTDFHTKTENKMNSKTVYLVTKRSIDLIVATILLILTSPFILIAAIAIRLSMGSPVIFRQKRPGLNEEIFTLYKFRTMNNNIDKNGKTLADNERLTRIGKFIRSTSIDELPQLLNIFKGDMSLIGPRPLLVEYLELYCETQKKRHTVRPGISGWAQINGRNNISWAKKFDLDVWYVENQSLLLDLKIIILTALKVLTKSDISKDGMQTTEAFNGKN